MRVIFFGTPLFAANVLEYLIERGVEVVAAVSKPDRPKGRSARLQMTPVKEIALKHNLPIYQPEIASDIQFADILKGFNPDLFVVVAYGEIIKQHLLDMPQLGCINLHASLLPKYRGAAPIHRCIIEGETETGVTIMHMVKKMDAGDIIRAEKVLIGPEMTFGELQQKLCEIGKGLLYDVICDFDRGKIVETSQDHQKATFAPRIELEDCEVDWSKPASVLHNLIRGTNPTPGAWCYVRVRGEKRRLKIYKSEIMEDNEGGEDLDRENLVKGKEPYLGFVISCGVGKLKLLDVQLEGKRRMNVGDLIRGNPDLEVIYTQTTIE